MSSRVSHHWQLGVILAVFAGLALAYSLELPLGEAADETDHFALVRFIADQERPPLTVQERRAIGPKGDASPVYHGLVVLITQHVNVSALPSLPDTQQRPERFIPTDGFRANRVFHTEDEQWPFRGIVLAWHLARLVSIPLGAATVIAAYLTALTIYPRRRYFALAVAAFVAFLPRFVINSAVVNDDNLVIPLVAFSVYYLVRLAQGDWHRRTFVILGALMGGAAIAKYHALVLLPEMAVVLLVLAWRARRSDPVRGRQAWRPLLAGGAWTLLAFGLVAGWWFAFLVVQFNQVAELGLVRGLMSTLGDPVVTGGFGRVADLRAAADLGVAFGWSDWADLFFRSFWVSYAWLHVFATPVVYQILGFFTLVAVAGLSKPAWQAAMSRAGMARFGIAWRSDVAVLALHFIVYMAVIAMRYWMKAARETGQGRHLYPALTAVAFFFVLGLANSWGVFGWLSRRLPGPARRLRSGLAQDKAVALSLSGALLGLSVLTPPVFILPEYLPLLPIVTAKPDAVAIPHRLHTSFARGLDFEGYAVGTTSLPAGEAIPITLYWYAGARQERDYLVDVCLRNRQGETVICRQGYPVDGRYPMRAWEVGYLIRDQVYLPTPTCLAPGDYELTMAALPVRLDTASTTIDRAMHAKEPVSLGQVALTAARRPTPTGFELWLGDTAYRGTEIELNQIRQSVTVIDYRPVTARGVSLQFERVEAGTAAPGNWLPLACADSGGSCPAAPAFRAYTFVADPAVAPGRYQLAAGNAETSGGVLTVATRFRDFGTPQAIPNPLNASFNAEVELSGYTVDLAPRRPDETIDINTYWHSRRTMSRHYVVVLYLLDFAAGVGGQSDWTLGGHYPNVLWAPGERVDEEYSLPVNHQTPPGLYTIQLGLYDYQDGPFRFLPITGPAYPQPVEHLNLGVVRVMDRAETQPATRPIRVDLGNQIQLLGYDLGADRLRPGETLPLVLHWQATGQPQTDYTVFTQLIGPDGRVWGQQDNQPQAGRYPTSAWELRRQVIDRYALKVKEGAPPGQYHLLAGMYTLTTGQRLAAVGEDGQRLPGDAIVLTTVTVE